MLIGKILLKQEETRIEKRLSLFYQSLKFSQQVIIVLLLH